MVRLTVKCLASSNQRRFVERSTNGPRVRTRTTTVMKDVTGRPLLLPRPATTSARCLQKWYTVCIYRLGPYSSSYLRAVRQSISLISDLIALLPSPTSPSSTEAPSATPILSIAKMVVHRHVRIAIFRFRSVNLAHITSRFLIAFDVFRCHSELSTEDDRTNQVTEHVKHVYKTSNSRRHSSVNPTYTHHEPLRTPLRLSPYQVSLNRWNTMFAGAQKHRYQVKAYHESTADPIHASSYRRPLVRLFASIYTLYLTNELYIVSCVLAPLIVEGPLGPWGGSRSAYL